MDSILRVHLDLSLGEGQLWGLQPQSRPLLDSGHGFPVSPKSQRGGCFLKREG